MAGRRSSLVKRGAARLSAVALVAAFGAAGTRAAPGEATPSTRQMASALTGQACTPEQKASLLAESGVTINLASSCCSASGGIGCDEQNCTDLICAADPVCCTVGWDQICADEANSACAVCGGSLCPGTDSCCQGHPDNQPVPKCNNSACCGLVCEIDEICCVINWDRACKDEANKLCSTCGGATGDCCTAQATGHVGCSSETCAQTVCATDPLCCTDTWDATCAGEAIDLCPASTCQRTLTVVVNGTGTGNVTASGIACPGDCSQSYDLSTLVTLTAASAGSSVFGSWSGDCSGTSTTCDLTMSANHSATATFNPGAQTLTVAVNTAGGATGSVAATGINCPGDCSESYAFNTIVTLTEAPGGSSIFTGWSGGCSGTTTTCQVTMSQARSVTASFTPPAQTLTVANAGSGTGSITATGISCPGDCSQSYAWNTVVTLTASGTSASTFAGWSGDCAGTASTCQVTMSQARSVTGTFDPPPPQALTVAVNTSGGATGSVTATGINCPGDCSESYTFGTAVTLTETPGGGSVFTGWSGGGCSGTATTCQVTMSQAQSVTATFGPPSQSLTVAVAGTGTGSVTATGIACPGDCTQSYAFGTVVTLTAAPDAGAAFSAWSGACTGTALTCQVTMSQAQSVTATFATSNSLFKDGFESGDSCAWSAGASAPCP